MKIFINIFDTGGYPKDGVIKHMIQTVKAQYFHLRYFYDAHIFIDLVNGPQSWNKSYKKESK
jgi:hypothetical protein